MLSHWKWWPALLALNLLAIDMSAACGVIPPSSGSDSATDSVVAEPANAADVQTVPGLTPTPAAVRRAGSRTVPVKRDSISEMLTLDGVVTAEDRVPITYSGGALVADVLVKVGQQVKEGDRLLELQPPKQGWAVDVNHLLNLAQARLQAAQVALEDAKAQAAARQQSAAQQAVINQKQQQQAIAEASSAVRRAQDNLKAVQAGASAADRQAAQDGVQAAQVALQKAQDAQDRLTAGPDQAAMRAGQRDVTNAQIALGKAQADLDTLTRGPDAGAVREAQGQVDRAQVQLQVAQAAKVDPKADPATARLQHDAAIHDVQLALQAAQDRLVQLKQPPADVDVRAAKQRVQDTKDALATATDNLAQLQAGPDQGALDAAQAAVDKAQQGVRMTQAHAAEVNSHPTPPEVANAQDQVRQAQAALDKAQQTPPTPSTDARETTANFYLEKVLETQAEIGYLEDTLAKTHILAPFDGTVVTVSTKPGTVITSLLVVLTLAKPGPPMVHVDLTDDQAGRLSVGESAELQLDTATSTVPATVTAVTPMALDGSTGASADFRVSWVDGAAPAFGTPAQVNVTLQQKQGVLVVPKAAVHQARDRATVEVQDGTLRRVVNVQLGIVNADSAEILSGLTEGQMVLVRGS